MVDANKYAHHLFIAAKYEDTTEGPVENLQDSMFSNRKLDPINVFLQMSIEITSFQLRKAMFRSSAFKGEVRRWSSL